MKRNQGSTGHAHQRTRLFVAWLVVLIAAQAFVGATPSLKLGVGDFLLFKFQQHIGDEHYDVARRVPTMATA